MVLIQKFKCLLLLILIGGALFNSPLTRSPTSPANMTRAYASSVTRQSDSISSINARVSETPRFSGIAYPTAKIDSLLNTPKISQANSNHEPSVDAFASFKSWPQYTQGNYITRGSVNLAAPAQETSQTVQVAFDFSGITQTRYIPPDVQVGVGPFEVVEAVNLELAVYSKQGLLLTSNTLQSFFAVSDIITDPKVLYDSLSGRWFVSVGDISTSSILVAVSRSNNLRDGWYTYNFTTFNNYCPDQPIIGVSSDKLAISVNDFADQCPTNAAYFGAEYWIANKTELLGNLAAHYKSYGPDTAVFSVHPAQALSETSTQYLIGTYQLKNTTIQLTSVTGVPPGIVTITKTDLPVAYLNLPPNGVQLGTTKTVNTGDDRIQDAAWLNGALWLSLNDACTPAGDTQQRSCIRLTQIDTDNLTVTQDFDFGASGKYFFYPALRTDNRSDLDIIYGYSSSSDYPSLALTGQALGDPANTLKTPTLLIQGSAPETTGRYGDYFGAAVDPTDASFIWVAGEYETSGGWATHIAKVGLLPSSVPLTLNYVIQGGGSGYTLPRVTYTHNGARYVQTLSSSSTRFDLDFLTFWNITNPLASSSGTERWLTNQRTQGTAETSQTLTIKYQHQYFLRISSNPSDGGSVSPASSWTNISRTASLSATPNIGWQFHQWTGAGSGSYTGPFAYVSITVSNAINETADFYPGLTIITSTGGSVNYAYNTTSGSIPEGTRQTLFVPAGTKVTLTATPALLQDSFSSWNGTANSTSPTIQIALATPGVVTAHFVPSAVSLIPITALFTAILLAGVIIIIRNRKAHNPTPKTTINNPPSQLMRVGYACFQIPRLSPITELRVSSYRRVHEIRRFK